MTIEPDRDSLHLDAAFDGRVGKLEVGM